jgi:hypothetical protein
MPGSTPNRAYPFPLPGEPPAGHTQIQDLALAIDADKAGDDARYLSQAEGDALYAALAGNALQQFSAATPTAAEHAVTKGYAESRLTGGTKVAQTDQFGDMWISYGKTFPVVPITIATIGDQSPSTVGWLLVLHAEATTTQFKVRVFTSNAQVGAGITVRVQWMTFMLPGQ